MHQSELFFLFQNTFRNFLRNFYFRNEYYFIPLTRKYDLNLPASVFYWIIDKIAHKVQYITNENASGYHWLFLVRLAVPLAVIAKNFFQKIT